MPDPTTIFGAPVELVMERLASAMGTQAILVHALQVQLAAAHARIQALETEPATPKEATP